MFLEAKILPNYVKLVEVRNKRNKKTEKRILKKASPNDPSLCIHI